MFRNYYSKLFSLSVFNIKNMKIVKVSKTLAKTKTSPQSFQEIEVAENYKKITKIEKTPNQNLDNDIEINLERYIAKYKMNYELQDFEPKYYICDVCNKKIIRRKFLEDYEDIARFRVIALCKFCGNQYSK